MNKQTCGICGNAIRREKGKPRKAYEYELHTGMHVNCVQRRNEILQRHEVSTGAYISAVIEGLVKLFPEVEETESVNGYRKREKAAKDEIRARFPKTDSAT